MNIRHVARLLALPIIASSLLAVACGGDSDPEPTAAATPTTAAASTTVSSPAANTPASSSPTAAGGTLTGDPVDVAYIETVCEAGAAFVDELAKASTAYAQEVGESKDAQVIGNALKKHLAPVFTVFLADMREAEPPADTAAYHARIIAQLEGVTAKLDAADATALEAIVNQELELPPADVADRLNRIGAQDPDCTTAGFFIGEA